MTKGVALDTAYQTVRLEDAILKDRTSVVAPGDGVVRQRIIARASGVTTTSTGSGGRCARKSRCLQLQLREIPPVYSWIERDRRPTLLHGTGLFSLLVRKKNDIVTPLITLC